jgi:hypothetical protein
LESEIEREKRIIIQLNINIKKGIIHILPSFKLIYNTIDGYITFDLNFLIFELRVYIVYKYIKNKWRE